ncbi:hypothetical protein EDB86DRAFT_326925 [Lactarius hatsudake]|nr:hypothetical protein EDB86DRAFT_326925 [Lactarius hatsudake]
MVPRLIWHAARVHSITLILYSLLMPGKLAGKPNTLRLRLPSSRSACGQRNKPHGGFSPTLTFSRILGDTGGLVHEADHFSAYTSHFTLATLRQIGADFPSLHLFVISGVLSSIYPV